MNRVDIKAIRKQTKDMANKAKKLKKISLFSLSTAVFPKLRHGSFSSVRETSNTLAATLMLTSAEDTPKILRAVDGLVDYVVVDVEPKRRGFSALHKTAVKICRRSKVLTFKPNDFSADSLDAMLSNWFSTLQGLRIAILGCGNLGAKIALKLAERGADVRIYRRDQKKAKSIQNGIMSFMSPFGKGRVKACLSALSAAKQAAVVIGTAPAVSLINEDIVRVMRSRGLIVDAGTGNVDPQILSLAQKRDIEIICLNIASGYEGHMATLFKSRELLSRLGRRKKNGKSMISGGLYGRRGEIVVDDVNNPKRIYGMADGHGDLLGGSN